MLQEQQQSELDTQQNLDENDKDELYFDHEINPDNQVEYHGQHNKDGLYHGEGIQIQQYTKCFFKGIWNKGKKVKGIEIFPNNDKYEGEYQNDTFHGVGQITNKQIGYTYVGDFVNGKKEGQGKEIFTSGGEYEGQYKNNTRHGKGLLKFADGRQYSGDFVEGVPSGFGIYEAQDYESMKSLLPDLDQKQQMRDDQKQTQNDGLNQILNQQKQDNSPLMNMKKDKDDQDDDNILIFDYQEVENKQKSSKQYYYEGEFVDGYKHGLGRQYEPNGSYYYCYWEYNRKSGNILYYNAAAHKWSYFYYNSIQNVTDFYLSPFDKQVEKYVTFLQKEEFGFPPDELDASKQKIDECGIFGDQFEDMKFSSLDTSINQNIQKEQLRNLPPIDFHRISELSQFKQKLGRKTKSLFEKPIEPGQIQWNKCSDQQLVACIESLSKFPQLLSKVFTIKFELETVCFITLRLYSDGKWVEHVVDDFVPCFKVQRECVFANTVNSELGWVALQKVFSKFYGSYYYFYSPDYPRRASTYLQMLTGLPCKRITWSNLEITHDSKSHEAQTLKKKIFKKINSKKINQTNISIAYLNSEYIHIHNFRENTAFSIIDKIQIEEDPESLNQETQYLLLHCVVSDYKIESKVYMEFKMWEHQQVKNLFNQHNVHKQSDNFMLIGMEEFLRQFGEIHMLIGQPMMIQNNQFLESEIKDYVNTDNRFYFKFQLSLPQRILINVQQHLAKEDDQYLPVRMILAKEIGTYLSTKAEFIKQKFVKDMIQTNIEGNNKKKKDKKKSISSKQQITQNQSQVSSITQHSEPKKEENESLKKRQLKYQYVFGKGQFQKENMYKYIDLEAGSYVILIQAEGPDIKSENKQNQNIQTINFTLSLFSEALLRITKFKESENFLRNLYEQCIISAEQKVLEDENGKIEHFTRSDLQEREQGCNDLIITQYFLYKEGTYLQYLQNQSLESSSKSWRQKLYFRTENMKILDQPDPHKVDLYLLPGTESLIIIQQVGAKPFKLEGGEGICIIEKIGKNKNQDLFKIDSEQNSRRESMRQSTSNYNTENDDRDNTKNINLK